MKTIAVPRRARTINEILERARDEDVIVRTADGTEFLVTQIDDFEAEVKRTRRNKKLMAFLDARAKETDTISFAEVQRRLGLATGRAKSATYKRNGRRSKS